MKIFAIYDTKAEGFNQPFFKTTFGLAERDFKAAMDDSSNQASKFKEDFRLYNIGEFDQKTGLIVPIEPPVLVCDAH